MCRPMITYPPQANVLVQRMRRTNSYAASRGDKTVMRPFAKLLCILVYYSRGIFRKKLHYSCHCRESQLTEVGNVLCKSFHARAETLGDRDDEFSVSEQC